MATDPRDNAKRLEPYWREIRQAAEAKGVRPELLAAICLRETLAGWAPGYFPLGSPIGWGDQGHGFGLFQADDRTKQSRILAGEFDTVLGQASSAASEIAGNLRILRLAFPAKDEQLLLRASVAAYNARLGAVAAQLLVGADPDAVTTKGPSGHPDYGADVLARADRLRAQRPDWFLPLSPDAG